MSERPTVWVDSHRPTCGCAVWHTCEMVECESCNGTGGHNNNPTGWYWIDCWACKGAGLRPPVAPL